MGSKVITDMLYPVMKRTWLRIPLARKRVLRGICSNELRIIIYYGRGGNSL